MSFSPYDKKHVGIKPRHITDALAILVDMSKNEATTTWIGCCQMLEKNYRVVKRARIVADWYLNTHESKSIQFKRSERGRQSHMVKSLFSEDELLTMQVKSWARQDLEHINIQKSVAFINSKLLRIWTAHQLKVNKNSYP